MELLNGIGRYDEGGEAARAARQEALEIAVLALSPIVPHITHELWHALGHASALIEERWPEPDATALAQDTVEIVVQVNGKLRGRVAVAAGAGQPQALEAALADVGVQRFVGGVAPRKVIYVPGKLLNLVI
jgi:leucyl-tRNA synthetase